MAGNASGEKLLKVLSRISANATSNSPALCGAMVRREERHESNCALVSLSVSELTILSLHFFYEVTVTGFVTILKGACLIRS